MKCADKTTQDSMTNSTNDYFIIQEASDSVVVWID